VQLAYTSGDWGRGIEIGEKAADLARSTGQRTVLPRLLAWLSLIYIGRGDFETARSATEEAWQVARADRAADHLWPTDVHVVVPAHIAVAALHLALGEWRDAIRVAQAGLSIADRSGYVVWAVHHLLPLIAEAALNLRELDLAADTGRRMRAEAEAMGHALGLAWADACDAILTWLESDPVQGAASLRTGVDALESIPLKYEAARLRRQLAGRLFEAGDPAAAALELAGALALFRRLGADPEIERAYRQYEEMGLAAPKPEEGSEPLP
jgi:tetratricopeptide (TPR) repeat protein